MDTVDPVSESALPVYAPRGIAGRLSWPERALSLAISSGCLVVLVLALWIQPSHGGVGSHRELGLRECSLLSRTGMPCPTCGMTTSFAHFVRGDLAASFYVQPMGAVFSLLTAMGFWGAGYIAVTGRPAHRLLRFMPTKYFLVALVALLAGAWLWKIYIHVNGIDGW